MGGNICRLVGGGGGGGVGGGCGSEVLIEPLTLLSGISQVRFTAPVYDIDTLVYDIDSTLPTMQGKCRLAMDTKIEPDNSLWCSS